MRIRQIDALRAVAVLLVLGSHLTWHPLWSRFGWTGVDLFFVLSGFLISGLLFREYKRTGEFHLRRFLIRRALKIYPAYYFLLAVTVVGNATAGSALAWHRIWPDILFVQNYWQGTWGHLWSLGVEEQFYLFLPFCLVVLAFRKAVRSGLPIIAGVVMVACLVLRAILYHAKPFSHLFHMTASYFRFDGLFFGVLLSYVKEFHGERLGELVEGNKHLLLCLSGLFILPAILYEQQTEFMYVVGLSLLYLGYGGILLYAIYSTSASGLLIRGLSGIGTRSYSIYLFHLPVAVFAVTILQNRWHWDRDAIFVAYLAASIAIGSAMSHLIEFPVLRLRDRLLPPS